MKLHVTSDYAHDSEKLSLYSWAPAGLTKHQVEEYMSQLPNNKVPRIGGVGERYRQLQLNYQLPKQDFSRSYCKYLTYNLSNLTSSDSHDNICNSPLQEEGAVSLEAKLSKQTIIDRFKEFMAIRNELYLDVGYAKENHQINQECYSCKREIEYGDLAVYSPKLPTVTNIKLKSNNHNFATENVSSTTATPFPSETVNQNNDLNDIVKHSQTMLKPPFPSVNLNGHLTIVPDVAKSRLATPSTNAPENVNLNDNSYSNRRSPISLEFYEENNNNLSTSIPSKDVCWHPTCFVCQVCKELLVDLTHCVRDGKIYCERHFAETFKARCADCDELIFANEYTKAMNKDWHNGHFTCKNCRTSLTGKRYIVKEGHQYCLKCYEDLFANYCKECKTPIGTDSKDISYKDKHWHEKCFVCALCKTPLVDKTFASRDDKIYCTNCYDTHFASHCDGCGEVFKPGTKKMEYKGQQWHEKCFCCCNCKVAIGTNSFIPKDNKIYCLQCYEDKFATRCTKCHKVISSNGVTYKNMPFHRECFLCANCSLPLSGQKFACKDEKPYCTNCFAELFAKRCYACQNPITGAGGTKFVSFEDRNWHNECFTCSNCKTSLVGKGFIMDGPDILCPECAKAKIQAKLST